ncbi:MAG: isoleucine--tRNA ligase, partial [Gammaproteobacteria bacterium]|nr:isoleucine--tRNA ligase [Gammaproteobacteria bacterium]
MSTNFDEVKNLKLPDLEERILDFWAEHDVFRRCLEQREGGTSFTFYEGPPTANGRPGIHHVLGRTIKDVFCRYQTLKGHRVERKAGWDTHGLPVEIEVEKALGLEGREQVEAFGIAEYNNACRDSVLRYKQDWDDLTRRIGYWVDLEHPYVTYHNNYIESVWWLVRQMHEKGFLYRGHKIQWYSPGSGTVLSSHEVSLGYQEVNDPSVYVRFRTLDEPDVALLAWTTTPWTLPSNVGLAVGTDIEYVKVRAPLEGGGSEVLILARDRLGALKGGDTLEELDSFSGAALVGRRYEPLYRTDPDVGPDDAWRVVAGDFVSTEDGTGIVHLAPAFGADDYALARAEGLPLVNPVDSAGRFNAGIPLVGGLWFKDADKPISRDLRERGLLLRHDSYLHNYPHDWRKGTPLMSYPVESWFVRTTAMKEELIANNQRINWVPPAIRDGRFGNWLENNVDWALSRKRYWGTPLPIWVSDAEDSDYYEVIGSVAELREKCGDAVPDDEVLDLHRPFVDALTWPAPDGGTMRRVADVMDVWFDSGAMPYAQWHYPFENQDRFADNFPADFICEGVDQTRGWFYTLHAIGSLVSGSETFRNVVVNGLILDEKGEKMSKSKGNTVDPFETIAEHGADVLRWYLLSNSPPWENMKFSLRGLGETRRKFFSTLENVYAFMASYANIDGFKYAEDEVPLALRPELDRWIISRLNTTVGRVDETLGAYDATQAARAIEQFVDDLSNWYIRRSRSRFWSEKKAHTDGAAAESDKLAAYQTTYQCLATVSKLMSPIAPFFSEWLHGCLNRVTQRESAMSVHLADFPVVDIESVDEALEARMALARTIVTLTLLLRNQHRINVRKPLATLQVVTGTGIDESVVAQIREIVIDEVNVRELEC